MRTMVLFLGLFAAACGAGAPVAAARDGKPVSLVVGTVWTGDLRTPTADAFAFRDGEIIAVGSRRELESRYSTAVRISAGDGLVIPGVVDSHVHVAELGAKGLVADLVDAGTIDDMIERLRARYPNPKPGTWLLGAGWDEGAWASKGYPDRELVDAAFPNNPVARAKREAAATAGWYPQQAVSVERALRSMTIEGARAAFQEHLIGSIAVGKRADFVILSANPITIPIAELRTLTVDQVYLDGVRVAGRE